MRGDNASRDAVIPSDNRATQPVSRRKTQVDMINRLPEAKPEMCLRWPQVQPLVGVSRTTWWRMVKAGVAPPPIKLSENCVGWWENSIRDFQDSRRAQLEAA